MRRLLIVGGCGGAGVTTTAWGIASAALEAGRAPQPIIVDATASGGDLAARTSDAHESPATAQSWLQLRDAPAAACIEDCSSRTSLGVRVLSRDASNLPWRATFATVSTLLSAAGYTPFFDGGAPAWGRQLSVLLADPGVRPLIVIPARADAANRLRGTLDWMDREIGSDAMRSAAIVVTRQTGVEDSTVAEHLRKWLAGAIGPVTEIPYDAHLAIGHTLTWGRLNERTRDVFGRLLAAVS
jgi:MinD-like ATPase involved in chromosome partitioning or flagellar assembly